MNKDIINVTCLSLYILMSFNVNGDEGVKKNVKSVDEVIVHDLANMSHMIDESQRTKNYSNMCIIDTLISYLQRVYKSTSAYPEKEIWIKVMHEMFVKNSAIECGKALLLNNGHIQDSSGDNIHYEFISSQEILIYSKNQVLYRIPSNNKVFSIRGLSMNDEEENSILNKRKNETYPICAHRLNKGKVIIEPLEVRYQGG